MSAETHEEELTEHQKNWWGIQKCRRCNPSGLEHHRPQPVLCPDCDGSGWTEWAALATEPWSEIIQGLWVGGHDYVDGVHHQVKLAAYPGDRFDVIVSMYHRLGHEPTGDTALYEILFKDAGINSEILLRAAKAALIVADASREGKEVLSRCQAGLNRSSLVAGMALIDLGFTGPDAVQLIRARRSPWALCNEAYAAFLEQPGAAETFLNQARHWTD